MSEFEPIGDNAAEAPLPPHMAIPRGAYWVLALLFAMYTCHTIDRGVLGIALESIKHEFRLTDSQLGLLTGAAYGVPFALAGLPLGFLVDRVNRKRLLAGVLFVWSALTGLSSLVRNVGQLVIARMVVGAAESGGLPASLSLLSDLFPFKRRASAVSLLFMSSGAGIILSYWIGGFLTAHYGWRTTFLIAGLPGLAVALAILFTVREPKRGAMDESAARPAAPSLRETLAFCVKQPALLHVAVAMIIANGLSSGVMSWSASYFIRVQHMDVAHAGMVVALGGGLALMASVVVAGRLSDRIAARDPRGLAIFPTLTQAALAPIGAAAFLCPVPGLAVALFVVWWLVAACWVAPAHTLVLGLTPPRMRGLNMAIVQVSNNLIGYGLGPAIVGMLSDRFSLRIALAVYVFFGLWCGLHFYLASRTVRRDLERVTA